MRSLCLLIARIAPAAWVGAAALFVVTSIREVRSEQFDSYAKDLLIGLRFPAYYVFGCGLLGVTLLTLLAAGGHRALGRGRWLAALGLVIVALATMAVDYTLIFRPLAQAIDPPGQARPTWFEAYHRGSMWINTVGVSCALAVSVILNWLSQPDDPSARPLDRH